MNLPPLLCHEDGRAVTLESWPSRRRELLALFTEHIYGRPPQVPAAFDLSVIEEDSAAFSGTATRRQMVLTFGGRVRVHLLLWIPNDRSGPAPVFVSLNFRGNHTTDPDPAIVLPQAWQGLEDVAPAARGASQSRWPVEFILQRGCAVATACANDFDPDVHDGFANGIHALETAGRDATSGGTIAAWAWGLSRMLDALKRQPEIDAARAMAIGHSRMGKTALWAGATDERFAAAISNNSGCLGASLSRHRRGESIEAITQRFPHWFCKRCEEYAGNEDCLPVDQHQLLALLAPRPVYVASASEDDWADPEGEFLAAVEASKAYEMLGLDGLGATTPPPTGRSVGGRIRYHIRKGRHAIELEDWQHYVAFADQLVR